MRVLVLTVVHHPLDARVYSREIKLLQERGHDILYAAPWSATATTPPNGIEAVDLPRATGRSRIRAISAARALLAERGQSADLILIHNPELVPFLPRELRPKVVWDVHEDVKASLIDKPWLPRAMRPIAGGGVSFLESWAERQIHLVLADEGYQSRFKRDHPVVPNDVWVASDLKPANGEHVVHLGRHSIGRGVREIADVARLLPEATRLILIGPGDSEVEGQLREMDQRSNVSWLGRLDNESALMRCDGAIAGLSLLHDLPNYRHSRPTKIIEYMSRGVPVVSTPLPVAVEIVEGHECGFIVPHGDIQAVVDAVARLRDDGSLRARLGSNGHRAALAKFDWSRSGGVFVDTLERWAAMN